MFHPFRQTNEGENGYNGHLTSREAGSVGGQMVKNHCAVRIIKFER